MLEAPSGATLSTHPPTPNAFPLLHSSSSPGIIFKLVVGQQNVYATRNRSTQITCSQRMKYRCKNQELAFVFLLVVPNTQSKRKILIKKTAGSDHMEEKPKLVFTNPADRIMIHQWLFFSFNHYQCCCVNRSEAVWLIQTLLFITRRPKFCSCYPSAACGIAGEFHFPDVTNIFLPWIQDFRRNSY